MTKKLLIEYCQHTIVIDEIQIINTSGIPLYYYNQDENIDVLNRSFLQASFMSAISSFAIELDNGDVEEIRMQKKKYLLNKQKNIILIFASNTDFNEENANKVARAGDFLAEKIKEYNIQPDTFDLTSTTPVFDEFDLFIQKEGITNRSSNKLNTMKEQMNKLIFKSVGYDPGSCNIGPKQRLKRMTVGIIWFVLSFILFSITIIFQLPIWIFVPIFVINFMGFLGILQAVFKFCVVNAIIQKYDME